MYTFTLSDGSKYEAEVLGQSQDPVYPIRVRCRCISPYARPWQEFDTEAEWFRQRGLTPPTVATVAHAETGPLTDIFGAISADERGAA